MFSSVDIYVRDHTLGRWSESLVLLCWTDLCILARRQFIWTLSSFIFATDRTEATEAARKLVLIQHLHPDLPQVPDSPNLINLHEMVHRAVLDPEMDLRPLGVHRKCFTEGTSIKGCILHISSANMIYI